MKFFTAVAAAAITTLAGAAQASVSSFTDDTAFETACGTLEHVTFDHFWNGYDLAVRPDFLSETISAGGVTFSSPRPYDYDPNYTGYVELPLGVRAVPAEFYDLDHPFERSVIASTFSNPLIATLRSGVFSLGGHFGVLSGTSSAASLSLYHGTTMLHRHDFNAAGLAQGQPGSFVGFVSDLEITSVVFDDPNNVEAVSDLSLGGRSFTSPSPVPLPAGLPLLMTALGGAALLRRRG